MLTRAGCCLHGDTLVGERSVTSRVVVYSGVSLPLLTLLGMITVMKGRLSARIMLAVKMQRRVPGEEASSHRQAAVMRHGDGADIDAAAGGWESADPPPQQRQQQQQGQEGEGGEGGGEGQILYCVEETKDEVDVRGGFGALQQERDDNEDALETVVSPPPSLLSLAAGLLDRSTGFLSSLRFNMKRDAAPVEVALFRASRRPRWTLHVGPEAKMVLVTQDRGLLLRRAPSYSVDTEVYLEVPESAAELRLPANWISSFNPASSFVAVANWSGAVHVYATDREATGPSAAPAITLPPPRGSSSMASGGRGLVAGLAWRNDLELITLRFSGQLVRTRFSRKPGDPCWLELGGSGAVTTQDLSRYHRAIAAMALDSQAGRLVVAGGSTRMGPPQSVVTVWRVPDDEGKRRTPLTVEHEVVVEVGTPVALRHVAADAQSKSRFLSFWTGQGLARTLEGKLPIQCPVSCVCVSPGGSLTAVMDLDGGLTIFRATQQGAFVALGPRMTSLAIGQGKTITPHEVSWWSSDCLAVLDGKGHIHVLCVSAHVDARAVAKRGVVGGGGGDGGGKGDEGPPLFQPVLSTAIPVGRGASLSCAGDGVRLVLLQNYVGLSGRPAGRLVTLRKQTPGEAMMALGRAGKLTEAAEVARRFNLDTDPMFKAAWNEKPAPRTQEDVTSTLAHVKDVQWVMQQVLSEVVSGDVDALEAACRVALERSDSLRSVHSTAAQGGSVLTYRLKVLELRDRAASYRALSPLEPFEAYRRQPLHELAEDLSSRGDVRGLLALVHTHPLHALNTHTLMNALLLMPETVSPATYSQLLPPVQMERRPADWAEEFTHQEGDDDEGRMEPHVLEDWYHQRAEALESRGASFDSVIELCSIGLSRLQSLSRSPTDAHTRAHTHTPRESVGRRLMCLLYEVRHVQRLVYSGVVTEEMDLQQWRQLGLRGVVRQVIQSCRLPSLASTALTHLVPLVRGPYALPHVCLKEEKSEGARTSSTTSGDGGASDAEAILEDELTAYLAGSLASFRQPSDPSAAASVGGHDGALTTTHTPPHITPPPPPPSASSAAADRMAVLAAAGDVARASRPVLDEKDRLIRRVPALLRLVLRCCEAQDDVTPLSRLWDLVECLPVADPNPPPHLQQLQEQVDVLENRLVASEVLVRFGHAPPLSAYEPYQRWLAQQGHEGTPLSPSSSPLLDFRLLGGVGALDHITRDAPHRLDLVVVATMAQYFAALRGPLALNASSADFWHGLGSDVAELQNRSFPSMPTSTWGAVLLYASLSRSGTPPSDGLLSAALSAFTMPARLLQDVVIQVCDEALERCETGGDPLISRASATITSMPFATDDTRDMAAILEAVELAWTLAGEPSVDLPGVTPVEVREAMVGGYGWSVVDCVSAAVGGVQDGTDVRKWGQDLVTLAGMVGMSSEDYPRVLAKAARQAARASRWAEAVGIIQAHDLDKIDCQQEATQSADISAIVWDVLWSASAPKSVLTYTQRKEVFARALRYAPPHELHRFALVATEAALCEASTADAPGGAVCRVALKGFRRHMTTAMQHEKGSEKLSLGETVEGGEDEDFSDDDDVSVRDQAFLELARSAIDDHARAEAQRAGDADPLPESHMTPALLYLLGISNVPSAVEFLREAVADAEARVKAEAEALIKEKEHRATAASASSALSADEAIVRSLISRGFSKNGAIRAAVAVGNESADRALQWAILHSHDPGFDDPLKTELFPRPSANGGPNPASPSRPPPPSTSHHDHQKHQQPHHAPHPHDDHNHQPQSDDGGHPPSSGRVLAAVTALAVRYLSIHTLKPTLLHAAPSSAAEEEGGVSSDVLQQQQQQQHVLMRIRASDLLELLRAASQDLLPRALAVTPNQAPGDDDPILSAAALCRNELARYSVHAGVSGAVARLQTLVPSLDAARFRSDERYRAECVLEAVRRTDDTSSLSTAMEVSQALNGLVDPWVLVMEHIDVWVHKTLKSAYARSRGVSDTLSRFESILNSPHNLKSTADKAGSSGEGGGDGRGEGGSADIIAEAAGGVVDATAGGAQGGAAWSFPAESMSSLLLTKSAEAYARLLVMYRDTDGRFHGLLEVLCRMTLACVVAVGQGIPDAAAQVKRLQSHLLLLRRLPKVPGLTRPIDAKALSGQDPVSGWVSNDLAKESALRELRQVCTRDSVTALAKLAPRMPQAVTASLVYRAYAEKVLGGQDPLLAEEEASLVDPHERFLHRLFVAEPYLDKVTASDLADLVEGFCRSPPADEKAGSTPLPLAAAADRFALAEKALSIVSTSSSSSIRPSASRQATATPTDAVNDPILRLKRLRGLASALARLEESKAPAAAGLALSDAVARGEVALISNTTVNLLADGCMDMSAAGVMLHDLCVSARDGVDVREVVGRAVGVLIDRVKGGGQPQTRDSVHRLKAMLVEEIESSHDAEADTAATTATATPKGRPVTASIDSFLRATAHEEHDEPTLHTRAEVLHMVEDVQKERHVDLGISVSHEEVAELEVYNRTARLMREGVGVRVDRRQLSGVEGRVGLVLGVLGTDAGRGEGALRALCGVLRLWEGRVQGEIAESARAAYEGRGVDWRGLMRGWVLNRGGDDAVVGYGPYLRCWTALVDVACGACVWDVVCALAVVEGGRWRGAQGEEGERRVLEALRTAPAPVDVCLKVALSSPVEALRLQGLDRLKLWTEEDERKVVSQLSTDDVVLGIVMFALVRSYEGDMPSLLLSPLYRPLIQALINRHRHTTRTPTTITTLTTITPTPNTPHPPPFPASIHFLIAHLVLAQLHVHAAAVAAEAMQLHPALRTLEGVLSLLWSILQRPGLPRGVTIDSEGGDGGWSQWDELRGRAMARLEEDEEM